MPFLSAVHLGNLTYWKINRSPKHTTGFTRPGNVTFLVSHKKLTPILRKDIAQHKLHPDTAGATRRLVLPSSFTQPHNYTWNEAHLLPAALPRTHGAVGGCGDAQQGLLQGHGLPEHPEPRRICLDKRLTFPYRLEPAMELHSLPAQDIPGVHWRWLFALPAHAGHPHPSWV